MKPALIAMAACLVAAVALVLLMVPFPVLAGAQPQVDVARDFTAAEIGREQAYHAALRPWAYLSLALTVAVPAGLALTGLGRRLVAGIPGHWSIKTLGVVALLLGLINLATVLPDVRVEQARRRFGLSTRTWAGWVDDELRGLAVRVVMTALVALVVLAVARRMPTTWWAAGAAAAALLTFAGSYAYPLLVEPVFNRFTSLEQGQLRTDLLALARRDGLDVEDVLVADASRRTTALNAYVSGIGSTRRIVVYDTLLADATDAEVALVVAHELGHAKHRDVLVGTTLGALGAAAGVCGLFLLLSWGPVLRSVGAAGDPRVLPLVLFLGITVPLLVAPVANVVSRHIESRADLHALELTGDLETFVATEQRLARTNLSDLEPHPLEYALFFTHPTAPERIALAREWERVRR